MCDADVPVAPITRQCLPTPLLFLVLSWVDSATLTKKAKCWITHNLWKQYHVTVILIFLSDSHTAVNLFSLGAFFPPTFTKQLINQLF